MTAILTFPSAAISGYKSATEALELRAAAALDTSYQYTSAGRVLGFDHLNLIFDYVKGDETSVQIVGQHGVLSDGTVEGTTWKDFWIILPASTGGISEVLPHILQFTAASFAASASGGVEVSMKAKQCVRFGVKRTLGTAPGTLGIRATAAIERGS